MQALFVHGMGRLPLSGWPMLHKLRADGLETVTFGYVVTLENFASIRQRLVKKLCEVAARGDYIVIGHSLGGVLLRAAINNLPEGIPLPKHVFLVGSPIKPARWAQLLGGNPLFRLITRDCGQLLGSEQRMGEVGSVPVPVTAIVGDRGLPGCCSPFAGATNDMIVSLPETSADWVTDYVRVPITHSFLPSSRRVAGVVLERLRQQGLVA